MKIQINVESITVRCLKRGQGYANRLNVIPFTNLEIQDRFYMIKMLPQIQLPQLLGYALYHDLCRKMKL